MIATDPNAQTAAEREREARVPFEPEQGKRFRVFIEEREAVNRTRLAVRGVLVILAGFLVLLAIVFTRQTTEEPQREERR